MKFYSIHTFWKHQILFSFQAQFSDYYQVKLVPWKEWNTPKKIADNSEPALSKNKKYCVIHDVANSNSFRNPGKVEGFASFTVCRNDFNTAYGGENDTSRHKDTLKHKGYIYIYIYIYIYMHIYGCCTMTKRIKQFWCKLSDCKLKPKSCESWTAFFWVPGWTQPCFQPNLGGF